MKPLTAMNVFSTLRWIVCCASVTVACEDRNSLVKFWAPSISVDKGDRQVTLNLANPMLYANYAASPIVHADNFNIMISEDLQSFTLYKRVDYSTTSLVIDGLTNDKPYYFVVEADKQWQASIKSNTVMTIPSHERKSSEYLADPNLALTRLSLSFDAHYFSFFNDQTLYIKGGNASTPVVADSNVRDFSWSSVENQAVYLKFLHVGSTYYPNQLRQFLPETNTSTTILEVPDHQYSIFNPIYNPSGESVTFFSDEGLSPAVTANIWSLDLKSGEKNKLADFAAINFYAYANLDWSANGDKLYVDGTYDQYTLPVSIYSWSVSAKTLTPAIKSQWSDTRPTLSPDNKIIAFVSDRAGKPELWAYNNTANTYAQITGGGSFSFDSRYTNIQWVNDGQILISVFENDHWRVVKIDVN